MCDVRQPTVSIRWEENPGVPVSTTKSEMPWEPSSGEVFAATMTKSAIGPFVMNVLVPESSQPASVRWARAAIPATSDPAPGSVTASAPMRSPAMAGTR